MENIETIVIDSDNEQDDEQDMDIMDSMDVSGGTLLPKDNITIAEEKKNIGNDQYKLQNYGSALHCYTEAITMCPETAAYYGNRSACYMMLCDYKNALADARQSVQIDDKFEKGYVRVVKCCVLLGDIVQAEQAIKKIQEIDPTAKSVQSEIQCCKKLRSQIEMADACYQKQDYRPVVFYMDSALQLSPACVKFKLLKAECLAMLGRIDQANDLAVSCMQTESTNAEAVYVRGLCLYYNDNLDKGLIHFQRALTLDPDNTKARQMRVKAKSLKEKKEKGNELFNGAKFRDAHAIYTEALQIDPLNKDINSKLYYNRALVNLKIGNVSDAIKDCTCALEANAGYMKALLLRARCRNDMSDFEECVKDYEAALKIDKTAEIKQALREAKLALKKSKRKDYYKILGIDKNASDNDIKKAYRKRALVHHPDRHANATEEEKRIQETRFKELGEAYTVLSDQQKRSRYDTGQDVVGDDQGGIDPNQIYRQFFHFYQDQGPQSPYVFKF